MKSVNLDLSCASRYFESRQDQHIAVVILSMLFLLASPCMAQLTNVTDVTSTPIPSAGHNYIGALSDTVNPADGAVSLRIQVPVPAGRGITMPFSFVYDSNGVHFIASGIGGYGTWNSLQSYLTSGGWSYSIPQLTYTSGSQGTYACPYYTAYVFQDNQGTRYAFPMGISLGGSNHCSRTTSMYRTTGQYAANLIVGDEFAIDGPEGTVYTFGNGCALQGATSTALPSSIEDRNGNRITLSGPPTNCNGSFTVTDTAGRTALSSSGFGASGNTLTVAGLPSPYQLEWGTTNSNFTVNSVATVSESQTCAGINAQSGTSTVLSSLTLPSGQKYQFHYGTDTSTGAPSNPYGLLNEIIYPNGGYVMYAWGVNSLAQDVQFPGTGNSPGNSCEYHIDSFAVQHRYVSYDGIHNALQQDFQYATNWISGSSFPSEWSTKTTTVTNRDLIAGTVNATVYTYSGYLQGTAPYISSSAASEIPLEQSIVYSDSSGDILATETKTWQDPYALTSQTTVLPNGSSSSISFTYSSRDQVIEEDDTDYGQSSPTRKTLYTYQTFAPVPQFSNSNLAYSVSSIVDLPCQIIHEDGSSNWFAETDYYYDGGATLCAANTTGNPTTAVSNLSSNTHDDANTCPGCPGSYSPSSTTARGNLTKQVKLLSSGGTGPTTTYTYDETGQAISKTDPCGNASCSDLTGSSQTTTYAYTDNPSGGNATGNSNAYVTAITDSLGHAITYSYNYAMGALSASTDANTPANTTNYKYGTQPSQCSQADLLNRLTEVDYPDGGVTQYCYNDSVPSVETARLFGSAWDTSVATMDGMGHVIKTQLTSDPNGTDTVLTAYDGGGRIHTKTNPYRSTTDATYGVSTYSYDAISRPTSVENPDGSFKFWCYDGIASAGQTNCGSHIAKSAGDWVDFADEDGNDWQKTMDSFGRLTSVIEPSGGAGGTGGVPTMETDYSYDILNDFVSVVQKGVSGTDTTRSRGFGYDSLSRILSSTNPETGTINYTYDLNSNLSAKTSPLANATFGTQTINYRYDALNRLIQKGYLVLPAASTPKYAYSCYQYDSSSNTGANTTGNFIGRLTNSWTQISASPQLSFTCPSSPPATGTLSRHSILAYDPMGRLLSDQQCTAASCGGTVFYTPSYSYDLAGDVINHSNGIPSGVGSFTFTNTYDSAGHLASVTSNSTQYPTNLFTASSSSSSSGCSNSFSTPYSPAGALSNATFGTGLQLSRSYDQRLRINCENDLGNSLSNPTPGTATIVINGTDQTR